MQNVTISLQPTQELLDSFRDIVRSELANYTPPIPEGADLPELLTRKETAKLLRISLVSLHAWSIDTPDRRAILKPYRVNGRVRFKRADVLAALKIQQRFKS